MNNKVPTFFYSSLKILIDNEKIEPKEIYFLYREFEKNEKIWWDNFKEIKKFNLVLIGESPLRTDDYIYYLGNKKLYSPFLNYNHIKEFLSKKKNPTSIRNRMEFINVLNSLGILIAEMFPFNFNKKQTKFNYRRAEDEILINLFRSSRKWNFDKKLKAIQELNKDEKITYAFRYRSQKKLVTQLLPELNAECLGTKNHPMDKHKFLRILDEISSNH
ncbi:MAG: hypothetical protein HN733_01425 [Gammaproteobacteria bacterium]|nr:hypothetical protein [Gammaproteobacteria bacterium]